MRSRPVWGTGTSESSYPSRDSVTSRSSLTFVKKSIRTGASALASVCFPFAVDTEISGSIMRQAPLAVW